MPYPINHSLGCNILIVNTLINKLLCYYVIGRSSLNYFFLLFLI